MFYRFDETEVFGNMAYMMDGQKQLNVRISEEVNDLINQGAKNLGIDKGAYVCQMIDKAMQDDGYKADLEAAGASKDDLAHAKVQLDKVYDTVKSLINKAESAKEAARKEVQKDLDLKFKEIDRLNALLNENKAVTNRTKELYNSALQQKKMLEDEIQMIRAEVESKNKIIADKEQTISTQSELLAAYKAKSSDYVAMEKNYSQMQEKLDQERQTNRDLERSLNAKKVECNRLTADKQAYHVSITNLQQQIAELQQKNTTLQIENAKQEVSLGQIPDLKVQVNDLQQQLSAESRSIAGRIDQMRKEEEERWLTRFSQVKEECERKLKDHYESKESDGSNKKED